MVTDKRNHRHPMTQISPTTHSLPLPTTPSRLQNYVFPLLFVAIYGSGFVGAKYGLPYAEPLTFLVLRFLIASTLVSLLAFALRAPWPKTWLEVFHIAAAGVLTVSTFSAGVFVAIWLGLSPALSALIIALQPILVASLARHILNERLTVMQWCGLGLGPIGVAFVVGKKVTFSPEMIYAVLLSIIALLGLNIGNVYQKKICANMNVLSGCAI
jgi:drug/metabolite transporter (DMT)-like permease